MLLILVKLSAPQIDIKTVRSESVEILWDYPCAGDRQLLFECNKTGMEWRVRAFAQVSESVRSREVTVVHYLMSLYVLYAYTVSVTIAI